MPRAIAQTSPFLDATAKIMSVCLSVVGSVVCCYVCCWVCVIVARDIQLVLYVLFDIITYYLLTWYDAVGITKPRAGTFWPCEEVIYICVEVIYVCVEVIYIYVEVIYICVEFIT